MSEAAETFKLLPLPGPADQVQRLLLFVVRRMAAHGVDDAHAASALLGRFGLSYKRPLILLRALMAELARCSNRTITVAPCCCPRMTWDEARLIDVIAVSRTAVNAAWLHLELLTAEADGFAPLSAAMAVSAAFEDLGAPIRL